MSPYRRTYLEAEIEDDVEIAARSRVPVLITAPPDRAMSIAHDIALRAAQDDPSGFVDLQVCDTSAGDDVAAALDESRMKALMGGGTTILLREVHMLSEVEQAEIMKLLDSRPSRPIDETPRIITTSSVSLFDRVQQGEFNEQLFHRLNVIHIMVPLNGG